MSLFSGCGGFDLGFTTAGYRCISAFDADEIPLQVHRSNFGELSHCRDLKAGLPISFANSEVDVLLAGPPCQGFSTAGKRDPNDPRNDLLIVPALVAAKIAPSVVIVENVLGVTAGKHRMYWEKLTQMLRDLCYRICELKCNAVDHGVPQDRRRLLLIAWNTGRDFQVKLPRLAGGVLANALQNLSGAPNHSPEPLAARTVAWRIVNRVQPGQKLCNVRAGQRSVHTWEIPEVYGRTTKLERQVLSSLLLLRRRSRLRDFGDADPVTASSLAAYLGMPVGTTLTSLISKRYVRRIGRRYDLVHTYNGKYRRLLLDKPSPTVDTRFGDHRYFVHPTEHRGFTVREAARLQGFPDDFLFTGSIAAQYRMIGNAVPPPLAKCVASFVRDAILTK